MFSELVDLANTLDEHIEKGEKLELKKKSIREKSADLFKALTFDPYNPQTYHEDMDVYNPYRFESGGFLPHSEEYWRAHGKNQFVMENGRETTHYVDNYLTTKMLYDKFKPIEEAQRNLNLFRRSLERHDLQKAGAVPVGTVHTYSDGQRYVKQAEGKWVPVASNDSNMRKYLQHPNKQFQSQANDMISAHADKIARIKDAIERKTKAEKDSKDLGSALDALKTHFGKFYDGGKIPDEVHDFFEKVKKNPDGIEASAKKEITDQKKNGDQPKPAPQKHTIGVEFSHNGQKYTHEFKDVHADSHGDAVSKIMKIMDKKLPGHQMHSIHARSNKDVKNESTK